MKKKKRDPNRKKSKRVFFKTVVVITAVSEDEPLIDFNCLGELASMIDGGDFAVARVKVKAAKRVTPRKAAQLCVYAHSDPEFLNLDENGNEMLNVDDEDV